MKKLERIVLKGHAYEAPRTESVEIMNQGVLCASGANFNVTLQNYSGHGF